MFKRVRKILNRMLGKPVATRPQSKREEQTPQGPFTLRRWESARTTRLNKGHWQLARGRSINADLVDWLDNLRTRSAYETANNPTMDGVIETMATDVAGDNGPTLQVKSSSSQYNSRLEAAWKDWAENPDVRGKLGLVDFITLWIRSLWVNGELLVQKVSVTRPAKGSREIHLRLKGIQPRRLSTPMDRGGDPEIVLGVRLDAEGAPASYFIQQPADHLELWSGVWKEVPARDIIHEFLMLEDDQVRGVPWNSVSLDSIADLRDYDAQVLDAARQAADWSISLYTDHQDAEYVEVNESTDIERRTMSTLPPGWKPWSANPPQPSITYSDYRAERLRDMGRPRNMPLMMVRLDASKHNYSSARFDAQPYHRAISKLQSWVARRILKPLLWEIESELRLQGLGPRPADLAINWIWPKPKHVDEQKEAEGENTRLKNRTLPWSQLIIQGGDDPEVIARALADDDKLFDDLGLDKPWAAKPAGGESAGEPAKLEFMQKAWLGFQADGTVSDVMANLVQLKDLTAAVGLPVNATYVDPYLPVQDGQGNMVTGNVVKDSDGDIVGSDVKPAAAATPAVAPANKAEDDGEDA
jgi:lambda family phage portal protein